MKPVKSKPTFFLRDLLRSNHLLLDRIESGPILGCGAEGIALERFAEEVRVRSDNGSDEKRAIRWSHPAGLEIQALYEIFPDTRTVEISGRVANCGGKKLRHVRGPFSAFFKVDLHDLPAPRLTWFNGATDVGGSYPPSAYQVQEADLPFEGSVNLHGGSEGGRSTETLSPYLFVTIPERRQGFWLALEWPCRWIIGASHRGIPERERHLLIYAHAGWTDFDLEPGGSVAIPKITMGFYKGDAVDGSNAMRRHISRHVRPSLEDGSDLPAVFYNSFYEFGDAFTTESLKRRVDVHAEMGVEYFVLDAGWFQGGFRKGIGNWETEDLKKLPGGMVELARYVEKKGMKFGCWTEIEFAMADSDWATRHPEWYRSAPHRQNLFGALPRFADRLLRLDDPAVRAAVGDYLENWVNKNHIRWLRWDFNNTPAPFWEAEESEHEMGRLHLAYGEGLYVLRDDFMARCPSVHIETCAGGGGRMDLGSIRRAHSAWMNDNSTTYDAVRRMQAGLNRILPAQYGNSCFFWGTRPARKHPSVKAKLRREGYPATILRSRFAGGLGFAEDFTLWSRKTRAHLTAEIVRYKEIRHLLDKDFYPLFHPTGLREFDGWQFHNPLTGEGFFQLFRCESPKAEVRIQLCGLKKNGSYQVQNMDSGKHRSWRGGQEMPLRIPKKNGTLLMRYAPNS